MRLPRRRRLSPTEKQLPPEERWRIDYARNELVNGETPPRRIPIQPGEPIIGAVLRAGIVEGAGNGIYQRLDQ